MAYKIPVAEMTENASVDQRHIPAKHKDMAAIDMPTELVDDWERKAIAKFAELLDKYRGLRVFMDTCVRCGACWDKCHYYIGTGDPNNMPVARAELLRKVYRRYFTLAGKLLGEKADAADLDLEMLEKWKTYFYQCSECRRCSVFCPYGIDTAEITMAAREIMAEIGVGTKYVTEVVAKVYETGNNLGIPGPAWKNNCEFFEDDVVDHRGEKVAYPVDVVGADVLLVPPSADNFANDMTMEAYGKVFKHLGVSWTTSTYASEGGNFGLFFNYKNLKKVNQRMIQAARDLKVKILMWGECGHAWRGGIYTNTLSGPMDFLDPNYQYPIHILQWLTDDNCKRLKAFKVDKSINDDRIITYHDPCNPARAGQLIEEPRVVMRYCCNRFHEMPPNTIKEYTFCCGSGGGLLTDEIMPMRYAGGKPRADAAMYVHEKYGVEYMATPCAICKAGLPEMLKYHKVPVEVTGVLDNLVRAMVD